MEMHGGIDVRMQRGGAGLSARVAGKVGEKVDD